MNIKDPFNRHSRRNFVKKSSLLAGGVIAAPFLSRANFFSGSADVIKIALIGCGGRGTGAAVQALSTKQNVQLVAMADAFKDRLDDSYKNVLESLEGKKARVQVKEENKFVGFDPQATERLQRMLKQTRTIRQLIHGIGEKVAPQVSAPMASLWRSSALSRTPRSNIWFAVMFGTGGNGVAING